MDDFDFTFEDMPVSYPVGEHSFRELRRKGCLYVDKTFYVARLIAQGKFIFLSRPRRFGKSLLLSTIECFFRGEKELFDGTWIAQRVKVWRKYPVLHFDMTETTGQTAEQMTDYLLDTCSKYEAQYNVNPPLGKNDVGARFNTLIKSIHAATGMQVVILIDEYDKGILETLDESEERKTAMSDVLRAFYSQPKAATESVKFCMVTGIARFGSFTLFSGGNNYYDISMDKAYAAICGITQQELVDNFREGIESLALARKESQEETLEALRQKYDSYRFTDSEKLVYNPFSLLFTFSNEKMANYWIKTGISKVFIKYLTQSEFDLIELERLWVTRARMEEGVEENDPIPLLFQMGYLTIKEVDGDYYRLGIPNEEVKEALIELMSVFSSKNHNIIDFEIQSVD